MHGELYTQRDIAAKLRCTMLFMTRKCFIVHGKLRPVIPSLKVKVNLVMVASNVKSVLISRQDLSFLI